MTQSSTHCSHDVVFLRKQNIKQDFIQAYLAGFAIPLTRFDGGGDDVPVFAFETPQE